MQRSLIFNLLMLVCLAACSVNPVTGKRELMMVSNAQEIEIGKQNYVPMQQSQGGLYDVDPLLTRFLSDIGQRVAQPWSKVQQG